MYLVKFYLLIFANSYMENISKQTENPLLFNVANTANIAFLLKFLKLTNNRFINI